MSKVVKNFSVISDTSYPNTSNMLQMFSNYRSMRIEVTQLISSEVPTDIKDKVYDTLEENIKSDAELQKKYQEVEYLPGEEVLYLDFRKYIDESIAEVKTVMEMYKKGKVDAESHAKMIQIVNFKLGDIGVQARTASHKLRNFHYEQAELAEKTAKDAAANATFIMIVTIAILGFLGIAASFIFSNALTKALKAISDALDESSTQVSSAAGQIASSSEELSQAATEQAASLEETSASVEEMSSMISINSENAKKASENSVSSHKQAERGRQVVSEMVASMAQINESNNNIMTQINASNEQMGEIVKVIQEIESKTKVINDIVFQTKLLSFNASVEAARAGEQGKGFAVVAEEVGNLAQMSGNAAKEISEMLASSINKVESIANETKTKVDILITDGAEKVRMGTKVAEECGEVLADIVTNVSSVSTMASEISNASLEQSKGIQEITKAMGQLDQVTQTNSATSEEAASAAEELSAQADSLKNQVLTLVAVINGSNAPVHTTVDKKPNAPKQAAKAPVNTSTTTNVIHMKKPAPKKAAAKVATTAAPAPAMKKAANGGTKDGVPSYDHPGFEEV
nr:methyl-accepting chemotaxis protein [Bacteriovorax sp. HI3]